MGTSESVEEVFASCDKQVGEALCISQFSQCVTITNIMNIFAMSYYNILKNFEIYGRD